MQAYINKIIPLSTVDGPGLRTSIFFQGCNIHCLYCHNPETQNLCSSCALCVKECPSHALSIEKGLVLWNEEKCIQCDHCISICPHNASAKVKMMTPEEVFLEVKKNMPFIRGITTSGGECALYPEFLLELFSLAKKEGLTCLMDSNGMIDYSLYPELMNVVDGVMLDVKSWDDKVYHSLTGAANSMVRKNLRYLHDIHKIEELRIVVVNGYVDAYSCLDGIKETLKEGYQNTRIKLITFRKNGVKGVLKDYPSPSKEDMNKIESYARSIGFMNIELR